MSAYSIASRGLAGRKIPQSVLAAINTLLFGASEQGAWYDPSDLSTLFQDSAGTTPVTAVEQPVGLILDKSGRGNHATQATTTKRPVLKIDAVGCYYLSFDGVDDALQTGSIDFTGTDKMTVWAGVENRTSGTQALLLELTAFGLNPGAFSLYRLPSNVFAFSSIGPSPTIALTALVPAGILSVITGTGDVSTGNVAIRHNGASTSASNAGSGNYANAPLYIGSRAGSSNFLTGKIYSLIARGAQSSQSQIEATELYIKQKMRLP